jgi:hypothetical protein
MTGFDDIKNKTAEVVRAWQLIGPHPAEELCSMLRRLISGLSPEEADKALVEFFHEIEVCDHVAYEYCSLTTKLDDDEASEGWPS